MGSQLNSKMKVPIAILQLAVKNLEFNIEGYKHAIMLSHADCLKSINDLEEDKSDCLQAIDELQKLSKDSAVNLSPIIVHAHPIIEMQINNFKKDEVGYIADCVLRNTELDKIESSFFIDEYKANEIINLMQSFINSAKNHDKS